MYRLIFCRAILDVAPCVENRRVHAKRPAWNSLHSHVERWMRCPGGTIEISPRLQHWGNGVPELHQSRRLNGSHGYRSGATGHMPTELPEIDPGYDPVMIMKHKLSVLAAALMVQFASTASETTLTRGDGTTVPCGQLVGQTSGLPVTKPPVSLGGLASGGRPTDRPEVCPAVMLAKLDRTAPVDRNLVTGVHMALFSANGIAAYSGHQIVDAPADLYPPANKLVASPGNTTYYIDPEKGNNANDGRKARKAWKSLAKVNGLRLAPGDKVIIAPGVHT
jgi:hypothetical protein